MIPSSHTNLLYLADTLPIKYPDFFHCFEKLLKEYEVNFHLLAGTKDVWARDYMPVQIKRDKFVRFVYNPKYRKYKKYEKTISDVDEICV